MSNPILGAKSYLVLASEDVWGRNPNDASGSGTAGQQWVHMAPTEYSVRFRPENRQGNPFIGIFQRKHSRNFRGMPAGRLVTPLYGFFQPGLGKSNAEFLMDWAFGNHESTELPSKTAQWAEGPGIADKEHRGLRVNSATLEGSEDSGVVTIALDLMGKEEDGNGTFGRQAIPNDREKLVDFEYQDCTFQLAGATVTLQSFSVQVQHGLTARYHNSFTPTLLLKTQRIVTVTMVPMKDSDTYDAMRRATTAQEFTGRITAQGLHNGTGASGDYAKVQIDFDRLSFIDSEDQGNIASIMDQGLNLIALKPDTSNNEMRTTWSLV